MFKIKKEAEVNQIPDFPTLLTKICMKKLPFANISYSWIEIKPIAINPQIRKVLIRKLSKLNPVVIHKENSIAKEKNIEVYPIILFIESIILFFIVVKFLIIY